MERINRLMSYLSKNELIDCASIEEFRKPFIEMHLVLKCDIKHLLSALDKFISQNIFFTYTYSNDVVTLLTNDFLMVKMYIDKSIDEKYVNSDVFNPHNLKYSKNTEHVFIVKMIDEMLLAFSEYIVYIKNSDLICAYNSLNKANDKILNVVNALVTKKISLSSTTELIQNLPKDKSFALKSYMELLTVKRTVECSKMMIYFINDYLKNMPINIISDINLEYFRAVMKEVLNIKAI